MLYAQVIRSANPPTLQNSVTLVYGGLSDEYVKFTFLLLLDLCPRPIFLFLVATYGKNYWTDSNK